MKAIRNQISKRRSRSRGSSRSRSSSRFSSRSNSEQEDGRSGRLTRPESGQETNKKVTNETETALEGRKSPKSKGKVLKILQRFSLSAGGGSKQTESKRGRFRKRRSSVESLSSSLKEFVSDSENEESSHFDGTTVDGTEETKTAAGLSETDIDPDNSFVESSPLETHPYDNPTMMKEEFDEGDAPQCTVASVGHAAGGAGEGGEEGEMAEAAAAAAAAEFSLGQNDLRWEKLPFGGGRRDGRAFVQRAQQYVPELSLDHVHLLPAGALRQLGRLAKFELCKKALRSARKVFRDRAARVLFVSHRWQGEGRPDEHNLQYDTILRFLDSRPDLGITHIWIDYACLPQRHTSAGATLRRNVATALFAADVFLVVPRFEDIATAPHTDLAGYCARAWCQAELVVARARGAPVYLFCFHAHVVDFRRWAPGRGLAEVARRVARDYRELAGIAGACADKSTRGSAASASEGEAEEGEEGGARPPLPGYDGGGGEGAGAGPAGGEGEEEEGEACGRPAALCAAVEADLAEALYEGTNPWAKQALSTLAVRASACQATRAWGRLGGARRRQDRPLVLNLLALCLLYCEDKLMSAHCQGDYEAMVKERFTESPDATPPPPSPLPEDPTGPAAAAAAAGSPPPRPPPPAPWGSGEGAAAGAEGGAGARGELALEYMDLVPYDLARLLEAGLKLHLRPAALRLAGNGCAGIGLHAFLDRRCDSLQRLSLEGEGLVDLSFMTGLRFPRLAALALRGNAVDALGCDQLQTFVQTHPGLRSLDLAANRVGNAAFLLLAAGCAGHPGLTALDVSENMVASRGARALADLAAAAAAGAPLARVDFSGNLVTPEEGKAVAAAWRKIKTDCVLIMDGVRQQTKKQHQRNKSLERLSSFSEKAKQYMCAPLLCINSPEDK